MSGKKLSSTLAVLALVVAAAAVVLLVDPFDRGETGPLPPTGIWEDREPGSGEIDAPDFTGDPFAVEADSPGADEALEAAHEIEIIAPTRPRGSLHGRVLAGGRIPAGEGSPVTGATVLLLETPDGEQALFGSKKYTGLSALTDEDGKYVIDGIPAGRSYSIRCRAKHTAVTEAACPHVTAGVETVMADIRLHGGIVLAGTVTDRDGSPLSGIRVRAVDPEERQAGLPQASSMHEALTGDQGRYAIACLAPARYEVTAEGGAYLPATKTLFLGFLGAADETAALDFTLVAGELTLAGRVSTAKGKDLAGALVTIQSLDRKGNAAFRRETRTGKDGGFAFSGLAEGRYALAAQAAGYFQKGIVTAAPGGGAVGIVLDPRGRIEGTISAPGKKLSGFAVAVAAFEPRWPRMQPEEFAERSFSSGDRFRLEGLLPGDYTLLVKARGYAWTRSDPIPVESDRTTGDVSITLVSGGAVTGKLRCGSGIDAEGMTVRLRHRDYQPALHFGLGGDAPIEQCRFANASADGSFTITDILPGTYTLEISGAGSAGMLVRNVTVRDGKTSDVGALNITAGGVVIGTAFDSAGRPAGGVRVVAMHRETGHSKAALTDNLGRFRIETLAAGTYMIYVESETWDDVGLRSDVTVDVAEGATMKVELRIRVEDDIRVKDDVRGEGDQ